MRMAFICQAADENDPTMASTLRWIEVISSKPQMEWMTVIALRKGSFDPPNNVDVREFNGRNRFFTLARFYKEVFRSVSRGADCFFIYQGGPYPVLLLPLKLLMGKPVYQWKTHPHVSLLMRFSARFCDTKVFTATRKSFPMDLPKVRVVGQGIDTATFRPKPVTKRDDIVTVGRVAPSKRLDLMVKTLARSNELYGTSYRLNIYGPTFGRDREYRIHLEHLINELNLFSQVVIHEPAPHRELPDVLSRHRLYLHLSDTALDRSSVEAMACGLPIISANPRVEEIIPDSLRPLLVVPENDIDRQAAQIHKVLSMDDAQTSHIGQTLRAVVLRDHSVVALFDKILAEMSGS